MTTRELVHTPDELEALPVGTVILDSGLEAVKFPSGAWKYSHDQQFWEPEVFPVIVVKRGDGTVPAEAIFEAGRQFRDSAH